jgi:uncharacterized protein YdeI (BOF family)
MSELKMELSPAYQRIIKDIKNDDSRIQVTGYIKEISNTKDYFILDDKTGTIKVLLGELKFSHKKDDLINVIGSLNISMEGEKELEADIIQDMNRLNFEYYQKLYRLKKEL